MSDTPSELSLLDELSDEIDRVKAKNAALIGQVARLTDDLKRTQEMLSNEIALRRAAEARVSELLATWDRYAAVGGAS